MKSSILLVFTALCFYSTSFGQSDTLYLNGMDKVSKEDSFIFYQVVLRVAKEGRYHVKEYTRDNILSREWTYKKISTDISVALKYDTLDGKFIQYDTTGTILEEGLFINGNKQGEWKEYYEGTKKIRYIGNWNNGLKHGTFYNYYPSGKVKRREFYNHGVFFKGRKFDENGKRLKFTNYWKSPEPTVNILRWLTRNLKYPEYEKGHKIEGRVMVVFLINEEGSIADIEVLKSPSEGLAKEAVRVMEKMPKWKPLIKDDVPQKIRFSQTINFQTQ